MRVFNRLKRLPWLKLSLLPLAGLLLYSCLFARVYTCAQAHDAGPADAAIVLGAAVWGERPSPVFVERIRHAVELYQAGRIRAIIFTGGLAEGDRVTESESARAWALAHGVPAGAIFCETSSTITFENIVEARRIVRREGFARVLIISDPPHMRRALSRARDLGLDAWPSPTPTTRYRSWRKQLPFLLYETYHYAGYLVNRPMLRRYYRRELAEPPPAASRKE